VVGLAEDRQGHLGAVTLEAVDTSDWVRVLSRLNVKCFYPSYFVHTKILTTGWIDELPPCLYSLPLTPPQPNSCYNVAAGRQHPAMCRINHSMVRDILCLLPFLMHIFAKQFQNPII